MGPPLTSMGSSSTMTRKANLSPRSSDCPERASEGDELSRGDDAVIRDRFVSECLGVGEVCSVDGTAGPIDDVDGLGGAVGGDGEHDALRGGGVAEDDGGFDAFGEGNSADDLEVFAFAADDGVAGDARGLNELVGEALFEGAGDDARDDVGGEGGQDEGEQQVVTEDLPANLRAEVEPQVTHFAAFRGWLS